MSEPKISEAARRQGELWSVNARDWAQFMEFRVFPAQRRALELAAPRADERLLDVACGAAGAISEVASTGVRLDGVDVAAALVDVARERIPSANFIVADMMNLPYPDETFDVVTGFNAFQFPTDPVGAVREASRVAKVGARFAIVVWGSEEQCEASSHFRALRALLGPAPAGTPPTLAADQRVSSYVATAGLTLTHDELVSCPWDFENAALALRAMRSGGPVQRMIELVGDEAVNETLLASYAPYTRANGAVHYENLFRVLMAKKD